MNRLTGLLSLVVLSLLTTVPLAARVISYAPYTNRIAIPSHQDRTSRHFVLIEAPAEDFLDSTPRDVVLYDSTGAEEPRVITPAPGVWQQSAVYQKDGGTPLILLIAGGKMMMSEGGTHWRVLQGLGSFQVSPRPDVDSGGPFSNGLYAPIVLGNDEWPFVVTLSSSGVWAINRDGYPMLLSNEAGARVAGRNAAGDRFLIQVHKTVSIAAPDGTLTKIADLPSFGDCAGWITSTGAAYLQQLRYEGRKLYLAKGTSLQLLAEGVPTYPPDEDDPVPLRVFAVPTHDYEGAWILDRAPDLPTLLSRHTPSAGKVTVWSDDTEPQVEALIAGASGDTLLIQVHRDRPGSQLATPIIDPALAVWRTGQPAPPAYDELYVNEQWNKGFVIVDPDRIESGDAFVFSSGFKEIRKPVSRVSAPIGGGGDVVQEWGVVRGSLKQRLVLPGVARMSGAYGASWRTDVVLYNPLAEPQIVDLRFVPLGEEKTVSTTVTLGPHEIRAIPDVLQSLFSIWNGGGALHLLPQTGINAIARTYTSRYYYGYGTYGYGMHAVDYFSGASPRFPLTFSGAFPGASFRTNVQLTDTSGRGTHANLRTVRAWNASQIAGDVSTLAAGTMQAGVAAPPQLHQNSGVTLVVEPTRGTGIATVVAIDNRSNDATWIPPDVPGTVPRTIPVIGHVAGANGAQFRSDLHLHNPRPGSRYVVLTARKWDEPWRQSTQWVRLNGYETMVVPDALKTMFGYTGLAQLRYASPEDEPGQGVRVSSRTYTVDANGATYGCLVPPLNGFQIATRGDRLEILGAGGGAGFRTNIGLVDLAGDSDYDPIVRISIIGSGNVVLDRWEVKVPASGGIQLSDIFRARGIAPIPTAALLVVENVTGEQIAAYATLVDNATNDSTYLGSQLGARETN